MSGACSSGATLWASLGMVLALADVLRRDVRDADALGVVLYVFVIGPCLGPLLLLRGAP